MKLFPLLTFALCTCSCAPKGQLGTTIGKSDNLFPEAWPHPEINLTLAGQEIPAKVVMNKHGDEREIVIMNGDVRLESELYLVNDSGIFLKRIGPSDGEWYDPPIPLLKYPAHVGETDRWSGSYAVGDRKIPANAKISLSLEQVSLATGTAQALRCNVDLVIDDGSNQNVKHALVFWFTKGGGPVKRDFGDQIRAPR